MNATRAALRLALTHQESATELAATVRRLAATIPEPVSDAVAAAQQRVRTAPPEEMAAAARELLAALDAMAGAAGATVLIIDDDEAMRQLLGDLLRGPGRTVLSAATAVQAEQLIAAQPPNLILLDLMLGDIDGRNLLVQFREQPATATVPVIVLSGRIGDAVQAECLALGAAACLAKPFAPAQVLAAVSAQLDQHTAAPPDLLATAGNRAALVSAFAGAVRTAAADNPPCLAMLDVDNLAALNAARGMAAGDALLRRLLGLLRAATPAPVAISRWTDSAVLLLYAAGPLAAVAAAIAGVRQRLATDPPPPPTFSAGVVPVTVAELPLAADAAARCLEAAKSHGRNCTVTPESCSIGQRQRVLLADDDPLFVALISHRLQREGMTVDQVADGQAALQAVAHERYDLILLDVQMPVKDGLQVLRELRARPDCTGVPVIILTGLSAEHDLSRGLELGANDYLTKPFSPTELVTRARRLLRRK